MAYPLLRSLNQDLSSGMTDGTYRSLASNRGGVLDQETGKRLLELDHTYYGNMMEDPTKILPDGRVAR